MHALNVICLDLTGQQSHLLLMWMSVTTYFFMRSMMQIFFFPSKEVPS